MNPNSRFAVVQMRSTADVWENLWMVDSFVREAEAAGARAVFFPENVLFRGPTHQRAPAILRSAAGQELTTALGEFSQSWSIPVLLGAVLEASDDAERPYNSTLILGSGRFDFAYRKIHLFDFQGETGVYRESLRVKAGAEVASVEIAGARVGLSICFDLRFPELYRKLTFEGKATVLSIPAAFTFETGVAHWHALLKARAVENLAFVVASAQWGSHEDADGGERFCYGHSLVYAPWGELLMEARESGDELLICEIDLKSQALLRAKLPCLSLACLL
jgi:predicted amidohydrolase